MSAGVPTAVWVDGSQHPSDGLHVSARDRGLTLSDGLFETILVRHGVAFRLDQHLARLHAGLTVLEIPAPAQLRDWVAAPLDHCRAADASIRLTVTRGVAAAGVAVPSEVHPTVIVVVNPLPAFPPSLYQSGLAAAIASGRRNERAMTASLKTLAYGDAIVALIEARRAGADEALFLDTEGHCSEATASNLFIWTGTVLRTPPASCGALPGITRDAVRELANREGIPIDERPFGLDELRAAREAFLTSSLRGIAPLVAIDAAAAGRDISSDRHPVTRFPIGDGTVGALTRRLSAAYTALVDAECGH